MSIGYWKDCK